MTGLHGNGFFRRYFFWSVNLIKSVNVVYPLTKVPVSSPKGDGNTVMRYLSRMWAWIGATVSPQDTVKVKSEKSSVPYSKKYRVQYYKVLTGNTVVKVRFFLFDSRTLYV